MSRSSLFVNFLSRITFIMNIGKQAIIVDAHKIIDVNEELHDYGVLCARFKNKCDFMPGK